MSQSNDDDCDERNLWIINDCLNLMNNDIYMLHDEQSQFGVKHATALF